MARYGPKLERQQLLLGRLVDVGAELLTMSVSAARAHALRDQKSIQLASYICHRGQQRAAHWFSEASHSPDTEAYRLAKSLLEDTH
jgi:hypothetical protein